MISSLCLAIGMFSLWIYLRRINEKEKLFFALCCFTLALYSFFCAGLYNSTSLKEGMVWQRLQFASMAIMVIFLTRFTHYFTRSGSKRAVDIFTWISLVFFMGSVLVHGDLTLSAERPAIKHISLGRFFSVTYHEAEPGIIYLGQLVLALAAYIWAIRLILRAHFLKTAKMRIVVGAFILLFISLLNDIFVSAGAYPFLYTVEYMCMAIVISMAFVLINDFIDIQYKLENLNETLEHKVESKTEELRTAMETLGMVNDELVASNRELEEAHRSASKNMSMAANVQKKLYGRELPPLDDWEIAYYFKPAADISGDLYDIYTEGSRLGGIALFDVSGHGISAGLFTMLARSILFRNYRMHKKSGPAAVMEAVNRELIEEMSDLDYYLSGLFLMFDGSRVRYANAAHIDALLKKGDGSGCGPLLPEGADFKGCLLGLRHISEPFGAYEFTAEKGDVIVLFTDGLNESANREKERYGMNRAIETLRGCETENPESIIRCLLENLNRFTGDTKLADDLTIIVAKKK